MDVVYYSDSALSIRPMSRTVLLLFLGNWAVLGQGVLGTLEGRIVDEVNGQPVPGCTVTAVNRDSGASFPTPVSADGLFSLPLLSPGVYDVTVKAPAQYRSAIVKGLEVPVGGFIHQDFSLSLLADIWQRGLARSSVARDRKTVLRFYGPDEIGRAHV